jgi:hypothetical protein
MSWAEDMGYDSYDPPEDTRLMVGKGGITVCGKCGSQNIKVSKRGNEYCADLCWVDKSERGRGAGCPTHNKESHTKSKGGK